VQSPSRGLHRNRALVRILVDAGNSEVLGLKWKDVDWLGKTVSINRGVVKAIVDDVKSRHSARKMACADELLGILKAWKQTTEFASRKALQLTETLGWETGIEPATVGATVRCSTD
jgi:integrase